jgi:hypothetical protein
MERKALELERQENRRKDEAIEKLKAEMEQKEKDINKFRKSAAHHQARALELEKTRERFQVQNKGKEDKLTDSHIVKYEKMMTGYFGECVHRTIFDLCAKVFRFLSFSPLNVRYVEKKCES